MIWNARDALPRSIKAKTDRAVRVAGERDVAGTRTPHPVASRLGAALACERAAGMKGGPFRAEMNEEKCSSVEAKRPLLRVLPCRRVATLSGHDRAVLRAEVEHLIEALLPGARYAELLDLDWRPGFEREAAYWQAKADDCPASSEAQRECLQNAAAREFVLAEVI
jgi:hypothetical protein